MVNVQKYKLVLPLLLTFLGYCGGGKDGSSDNWLTTSDLQNLVAPAGITAVCQSTGLIKLTWDPSYDTIATHLQVFRKAVETQDEFVKIDEVPANLGIYSNVVQNMVYYQYQVRAIIRDDDGDVRYVAENFSPETANIRSTTNCLIVSDPGPILGDLVPLEPVGNGGASSSE